MHDINTYQLELKVYDTYERDEKITTKLEAYNLQDAIDKTYWVGKIFETDSHISVLEKDYNKFILLSNKQSIEEFLIQRGVKTTKQLLWGKKLFDSSPNAEKFSKDFLFVTRPRPNLEEVYDIFQRFCSQLQIEN